MIKSKESGQVLLLAIVSLGVVLASTLLMVAGSTLYSQNSVYTLQGEKATALAEAGVDKAVASLNASGGSYSGEAETALGEGTYSIAITTKDAATKVIEATGYLPNKQQPKVKRSVKIEVSKGVGVSFVYGIQVGEGGLELGHGNTVEGSVYSNGSITGDQNNTITGDAWVAGGPQSVANQETDCSGVNCQDFIFGKNVSGDNRLDIAQSFKPTVSGPLNKISLKVKKFGSPADVTVRVLGDVNGSPNKSDVLTSGQLYSSLVTGAYDWIDVTFSSTPNLVADTNYWLMVSSSLNSSNYWSWQNDLAGSYTRGLPKWSSNWNAGNPNWTNFSGDLSFKVYMGGVATLLKASNINFNVNGNVHANTIDNVHIDGDAFYKTIINSTVDGTLNPGSEDPPPSVFPISNANITQWKQDAASGGNLNAPVCGSVVPWGPGKYNNSLTLDNGCVIKIKSPVWITGNVTMNNDNIFQLDSSFGSGSGLIIVDGTVNMANNNKLKGTTEGNSLLMLLSTYDSRTNGLNAITIGNNGNTGVFYANMGIIEPGNNNQFKELTAWKIKLVHNSVINYESGLSSTLFSTGPSGTFSLIKGTYQDK